jgi:hypothetical protein
MKMDIAKMLIEELLRTQDEDQRIDEIKDESGLNEVKRTLEQLHERYPLEAQALSGAILDKFSDAKPHIIAAMDLTVWAPESLKLAGAQLVVALTRATLIRVQEHLASVEKSIAEKQTEATK